MRRLLLIVLLLLQVSFISATFIGPWPGSLNNVTVCAAGCNFSDPQLALNAAPSYSNVLITDSRVYSNQLVLSATGPNQVNNTLVFMCTANALFQGTGAGNALTLSGAQNMVIRNCTFKNYFQGVDFTQGSNNSVVFNNTFVNMSSNGAAAVFLGGNGGNNLVQNETVENNSIFNSSTGVNVGTVFNTTVIGNNVTNSTFAGIQVSNSNTTTVSNNNIISSQGIQFQNTTTSTANNNVLTSISGGGAAIVVNRGSTQNNITSNTLNITSTAIGVQDSNTNFTLVSGNTIINASFIAIEVLNSTLNTVTSNVIHNITGQQAIAADFQASQNNITNNNISSTPGTNAVISLGISGAGKGSIVTGNSIQNCSGDGIDLNGDNTTLVSNNTIFNISTGVGISLSNSASNDNVTLNSISTLNNTGIIASGGTTYAKISSNTISQTSMGIQEQGIGTSFNTIVGNTISKTTSQGMEISANQTVVVNNSVTNTNNNTGINVDFGASFDNITTNNVSQASGGIQLTGSGTGNMVNGNILSNLTITAIEISGDNSSNILSNTITNVTGGGFSSNGIVADTAASFNNITTNTVTSVDQFGIQVTGNGINNLINGNTVTATGFFGIEINSDNSSSAINNTVTNTSNTGIGVDFGGSFDNITTNNVTNASINGINIIGGTGSNVIGNIISNLTSNGISASGTSITINNNTISNDTQVAINANNLNNSFINFNTVSQINNTAISISNSSNNVLKSNTLTNIAQNFMPFQTDGIDLFGISSGNNITLNNITGSVIAIGLRSPSSNSYTSTSITNNTISGAAAFAIAVQANAKQSGIKNNVINSNFGGIQVQSGGGVNVSNNTIVTVSNNGIELSAGGSGALLSTAFVLNNSISNVASPSSKPIYGIILSNFTNVTMDGNSISNSSYGFWVKPDLPKGQAPTNMSVFVHNITTTNLISGIPIQYLVFQSNIIVPVSASFVGIISSNSINVSNENLSNNGAGILIVNSTNVIASNNNVSNIAILGIGLLSSTNSIVNNALIQTGGNGIKVQGSSTNNITNNRINVSDNVSAGIYLTSGASNNILNNNTINTSLSPPVDGIFIENSNTNTISNSVLDNNGVGMNISGSNGTTINANSMILPNDSGLTIGIFVTQASSNTVITNNTIANYSNSLNFTNSPFNNISLNTIHLALVGVYSVNSSFNSYGNNTVSSTQYNDFLCSNSSTIDLGFNICNTNDSCSINCITNLCVAPPLLKINTTDSATGLRSQYICPGNATVTQDSFSVLNASACRGSTFFLTETKAGQFQQTDFSNSTVCNTNCHNNCYDACVTVGLSQCTSQCVRRCQNGACIQYAQFCGTGYQSISVCTNIVNNTNHAQVVNVTCQNVTLGSFSTICNSQCYQSCSQSLNTNTSTATYNKSCGFNLNTTVQIKSSPSDCSGSVVDTYQLDGVGSNTIGLVAPNVTGTYSVCTANNTYLGSFTSNICSDSCSIKVDKRTLATQGLKDNVPINLTLAGSSNTFNLSVDRFYDDIHTSSTVLPSNLNFTNFTTGLNITNISMNSNSSGSLNLTNFNPTPDNFTYEWDNIIVMANGSGGVSCNSTLDFNIAPNDVNLSRFVQLVGNSSFTNTSFVQNGTSPLTSFVRVNLPSEVANMIQNITVINSTSSALNYIPIQNYLGGNQTVALPTVTNNFTVTAQIPTVYITSITNPGSSSVIKIADTNNPLHIDQFTINNLPTNQTVSSITYTPEGGTQITLNSSQFTYFPGNGSLVVNTTLQVNTAFGSNTFQVNYVPPNNGGNGGGGTVSNSLGVSCTSTCANTSDIIQVTGNGQPLGGASISVSHNGNPVAALSTNSSGQASFIPSDTGSYSVTATANGFSSTSTSCQVTICGAPGGSSNSTGSTQPITPPSNTTNSTNSTQPIICPNNLTLCPDNTCKTNCTIEQPSPQPTPSNNPQSPTNPGGANNQNQPSQNPSGNNPPSQITPTKVSCKLIGTIAAKSSDCCEGYKSDGTCTRAPVSALATTIVLPQIRSGCAGILACTSGVCTLCNILWFVLIVFGLVAGGVVMKYQKDKLLPIVAVLIPLLIGLISFVYLGIIVALAEVVYILISGRRR